jgi:hypothetical protein
VPVFPDLNWRIALKAAVGFLAGLLMWVALSPSYDGFIAAVAQTSIRLFERPAVTRLERAADGFVTIDRSDFASRSQRPAIPVYDLTFNFILLTTLFAARQRSISDRNIGRFVVASVLLSVTHVVATVVEVESIYALKLRGWSLMNYSAFERTFWGVASHAYRVVLMYAIAFGLWWIFRDSEPEPAVTRAPKRGRKAHRRNKA